jgi:septum formation protein
LGYTSPEGTAFYFNKEKNMHIILASASPRRRDLVHQMGWEADIKKSSFNEVHTPEEAANRIGAWDEKLRAALAGFKGPDLVCTVNALGKGLSIAREEKTSLPVVSADTIVVADEQILGKPADEREAARMLRFLSGRTHEVKTGLAVCWKGQLQAECVTTSVTFRSLTEEEIAWYVQTGEPMDKAGAYGIQGKGAILVEKIEGSYDNVVGLPLTELYLTLKSMKKK